MLLSNAIQISLIILNIILSGLCQQIDSNTIDSYTCKAEHRLAEQPKREDLSKVTKCCRIDENLYAINSPSTMYNCNRRVYSNIVVNFATVELFDDCIVFWNRSKDLLPIEIIGLPSDHLFSACLYFGDIYGSHIIQNGSLLVTNTYGHFNYEINNDYCLDVNAQTGAYMICHAEKVSHDSTLPHLAQSKNTVSKIFTIISIPCFVGIALLYLANKDFRTLHGCCVTTLAIFMTVEFFLQSVLNFLEDGDMETLRKFIHYLNFAHYFWILVIFTNGLLFVWIYLPYNILGWRPFGICSYLGFFVFCVTIPKVIADRVRDDELLTIVEFLTTPKTTIVLTCVLLLILTFLGSNRLTMAFRKDIFQKYNKNVRAENDVDIIRYHFQIEEVQNRLTCLTSLIGFFVILRVFSIPGHEFVIIIREFLNSLQGVVFLLIFIGLRYREIRNFVGPWFES